MVAAVGIALNARRIASEYRTYVLLGDGESAEGSVWEAADDCAPRRASIRCAAITDVNGLGQSGPSMWEHDMDAYAARWHAFGWHAVRVDGHDVQAILDAFDEARSTKGRPTMILAKTLKGKGISMAEGKTGWHGKAFKKGEEARRRSAELEAQLVPEDEPRRAVPRAASHGQVRRVPPRRGTSVPPAVRARRQRRHARGVRHGARRARRRRRPRSSRSTATSRTRPSAKSSRRSIRDRFYREFHRRAGDDRRGDGAGRPRRHPVSVHLRRVSHARGRLHPDGGDQQRRTSRWPGRTPASRLARMARRRWRSKTSR